VPSRLIPMSVRSDMRIMHRNRQEKLPGSIPEGVMKFFLFFAGIAGPGFLILGFWMILADVEGGFWAFVLGSVLLAEGIMSIQTAFAEFSFSIGGVSVKYPMEPQRYYGWNEFQQVCICYHSRGTEVNGYPILCLVKKGQKKNALGRWKTLSIFHYRSILCLDYSEELLDAVRRFCPYEIPDLRNRENYRL